MSERPVLRALAERAGILEGYHSALDGAWVIPSDATREALLAAMGIDAGSEAAARTALEEFDAEARARGAETVVVAMLGRSAARRLAFHDGTAAAGTRVEVEITPEDGPEVIETSGSLDAAGSFQLPELEIGRYELAIRLRSDGGSIEAAQHRFVVPERCVAAEERLGAPLGFGFWASLYSVRSRTNQGFGNLGDLTQLVQWAGREGAAFLGLNPMHALSPGSVCPYQPVSRLFRHPSYLDPGAIPELAHCPEARRVLAQGAFEERLKQRRSAAQLDAGGVSRALAELLEPLHGCFARGACGPERAEAFARYRAGVRAAARRPPPQARGGELRCSR